MFLKTRSSFGIVNLKPLMPGHILICPLTTHQRLTDLTTPEVTDLFSAVQLTQRLLARAHFGTEDVTAGSFTVAVQDGAEAGQTVPHVHVHIIPRPKGEAGPPDAVYDRMAGEDGNVGGALWDAQRPRPGGSMPTIEDADRRARTADAMAEETERYRKLLGEMSVSWNVDSS